MEHPYGRHHGRRDAGSAGSIANVRTRSAEAKMIEDEGACREHTPNTATTMDDGLTRTPPGASRPRGRHVATTNRPPRQDRAQCDDEERDAAKKKLE